MVGTQTVLWLFKTVFHYVYRKPVTEWEDSRTIMIQYYGYKTVYLFSEAALHAESGHGAVCVLHVRESLGLLVIYTHIRDDWHDGHSHPLAVSPGELHLHTKTGLWGHFPNGITFDWKIFWTSGFV